MMKPIRIETTSANGNKLNLEALYQIAPSCFTEVLDGSDKQHEGETITVEKDGRHVRMAINFKTLRQLLGDAAVEDSEEMYQFTWPGKQAARYEAATPIADTLRPVTEDSVDWDTTENLYIEGDNLRVLKLLQRGYMGKVKMIYIDPPYNTGNDFVYHDDFKTSLADEELAAGNIDEEGLRYRRNLDNNGRFHSDWCSMMYSRLLVARSLLTEDGVIFISIDDNEVHNLRKICDEVFGARNFVSEFIWRGGRRNASKFISTSHEYILFYTKDLVYCNSINIDWNEKKEGLGDIFKAGERFLKESNGNYNLASDMLKSWFRQLPDTSPSKAHSHYSWIDKNGIYFASDISRGGGGGPQWNVRNPTTGNLVTTPSRGWAYSKLSDLEEDISKGLIHFNGDGVPCKKRYLKDNSTQLKETVFYKDRRGASKRLRKLFDSDVFPFPKDEEIIKEFVETFALSDSLILDFFSGSATTAHAVMQLNAEDGGKRKYICVQLAEDTPEDSEARKAGYKNICEIGKERIRRAGKKIKEESPLTAQHLDTGFRVFRLAASNYEDVTKQPGEYDQRTLDLFADNIKADRTDLDLLFGAMLSWGVQLSLPMTTEEVDGCKIYTVDGNSLVACFAENITENVAKAMADKIPVRVLFRDSCFGEDKTKINIFELFKQQLNWDESESMQNIRVI